MLLEIFKVKKSREEGLYDVFLVNKRHNVAICVCVGAGEAGLIALGLENKTVSKPMMCDVFVQTMDYFGIRVKYVRIYDFVDGVYEAEIRVSLCDTSKNFECRLSDCLNLAMRTKCPIYTEERVVELVGFDADVILDAKPREIKGDLSKLGLMVDLGILEEMLDDAVAREDYEFALLLRDRIGEIKKEE